MKLHPSVISHLQQWSHPSNSVNSGEEMRHWRDSSGFDMAGLEAEADYLEPFLSAILGNSPYLVPACSTNLIFYKNYSLEVSMKVTGTCWRKRSALQACYTGIRTYYRYRELFEWFVASSPCWWVWLS